MDITYDESLIEYMKKKKYTAIVIEQIDPIGCCADTSELLLRFVNEKGADKLRDQAIRQLDVPFGELFVMIRGLDYDKEIHFQGPAALRRHNCHCELHALLCSPQKHFYEHRMDHIWADVDLPSCLP